MAVLLGIGLRGEEYRQSFDDETPNWIVLYDKSNVRVVRHAGQSESRLKGERAEALVLESQVQPASIQLEHQLPAARAIEELKLKVWFRSGYPGAALWLRIVFPHQIDPRTGKALSTFLRGDTYSNQEGEWQKLEASTPAKLLQARARQLRSELNNPNLNFRDAYIDRAIITCKVPAGQTQLLLDELEFGPVVAPAAVGSAVEKPEPKIEQTNHSITQPKSPEPETLTSGETEDPAVEFRLDRLLVEGRPFFPRIAAYHDEPIDSLKFAGLNVVWVQDYEDTQMLQSLRSQGLWAMATPPRAVTASGAIIDPEDVSIIPFGKQTEPIVLWNLGTRVPPKARNELVAWMEQIRGADRNFRRPVMVDILGGEERIVSRHDFLLGLSRHINHTTFSPKAFRNWLVQKCKLARPGTFVWTWIQTEPSASSLAQRDPTENSAIVIEPEQIRLQVYAALAAGCRGIGYWKTSSLESETPGAEERELAIAQLNLEIELLEPWLATGTVVDHVPFGAVAPASEQYTRRDIDSPSEIGQRQAKLAERANQQKRAATMAGDLEATIIRSDYGMLLLPIWYDREAQFVPGQMAANDAAIIVPEFDSSASAWEVTPTSIRSLPHTRPPGGKQIILKKFDQTAAVVITSDRELINRLRQKQETLAKPSARVSVALAKAKLDRVMKVDAELQQLGVGQPDAPQILARSRQLVEFAEAALRRNDYDGARQMAADAMQLQRILQRTHWEEAVRKLTSPVSSPHTICFQTLPDHWRLISRLGDSRMDNNNLLRSGNFEDINTMLAERWQHSQKPIEGIRAAAELYPDAKEGSYSLRMAAAPTPGKELPTVLAQNPVTVTTPPVMVQSGQVVSVSGWVRVTSPISHSLDGAILYDNLGGPISAMRWQAQSDWQRFSLLREVQQSGSFTVTMSLGGLGEIQFDDLKIIPHDPRTQAPAAPEPTTADPRNPFTSPLKLLQQFPRIPNWPAKN